ncbi:MAG: hypothetical protein AAF720_02635 [Pseudomonadota bacterium]
MIDKKSAFAQKPPEGVDHAAKNARAAEQKRAIVRQQQISRLMRVKRWSREQAEAFVDG